MARGEWRSGPARRRHQLRGLFADPRGPAHRARQLRGHGPPDERALRGRDRHAAVARASRDCCGSWARSRRWWAWRSWRSAKVGAHGRYAGRLAVLPDSRCGSEAGRSRCCSARSAPRGASGSTANRPARRPAAVDRRALAHWALLRRLPVPRRRLRDSGQPLARRRAGGSRARATRLGPSPRGSSSRGGVAALAGSIRAVRAGHGIGFLCDGPRGPARRCKPGVIAGRPRHGHRAPPDRHRGAPGAAPRELGPELPAPPLRPRLLRVRRDAQRPARARPRRLRRRCERGSRPRSSTAQRPAEEQLGLRRGRRRARSVSRSTSGPAPLAAAGQVHAAHALQDLSNWPTFFGLNILLYFITVLLWSITSYRGTTLMPT